MKIKAAVVMPFANFWKPLRWKNYPALGIIDKHLRDNRIESIVIDMAEEVCKDILKNVKIEDYENGGARETSFVHFLKKYPERVLSNKEFYTELMKPFSYFGDEYGGNRINRMKDAERLISTTEGQRLFAVIESVIKKDEFKRDLFFVTVPTNIHIISAMMIGRLLKKYYPTCHICFGGPYITMSEDGEWLVKDGYCDTFVRGPGENKITDLLGKLESGPRGEIVSDEKEVDINLQINDSSDEEGPAIIILSRGCIWGKCNFCDYRQLNVSFSIKKIDVLLREIESIINRQGKNVFYFITDTIPPTYARKLSVSIINKGWNITWSPRYVKIDKNFDKELFRLMKKSGCDLSAYTNIGIDSVSEKALKYANKGYTRKDILRFLEDLKGAEMRLRQINMIYDLPGTSFKDGLDSVDILERFIDTYNKLSAHPFQLTITSDMGKNPDKYGLKIVKGENRERIMSFCNNLDFIDNNGFTKEQRKILKNKYYHIVNSLRACILYRNLDRNEYNSIKLYNPKRAILEVKIPESVEKIATNKGEIYVHADMLADDLIMKSQYFLSKVKPGNWYSVEQLASFKGGNDQRTKFITNQKTFRYVRDLLARGYFSEVKFYNKNSKRCR